MQRGKIQPDLCIVHIEDHAVAIPANFGRQCVKHGHKFILRRAVRTHGRERRLGAHASDLGADQRPRSALGHFHLSRKLLDHFGFRRAERKPGAYNSIQPFCQLDAVFSPYALREIVGAYRRLQRLRHRLRVDTCKRRRKPLPLMLAIDRAVVCVLVVRNAFLPGQAVQPSIQRGLQLVQLHLQILQSIDLAPCVIPIQKPGGDMVGRIPLHERVVLLQRQLICAPV